MKVGVRKPNMKKRLKARTTGKLKRSVKRSVNPLYGKKGMGYIKDPERAIKNKIYKKTTVSVDDIAGAVMNNASNASSGNSQPGPSPKKKTGCLIPIIIFLVLFASCSLLFGGENENKKTESTTEITTVTEEVPTTSE